MTELIGNSNRILELKPKHSKKLIVFQREEKRGYISLIPKYASEVQEIFLNQTIKKIMQLCDGNVPCGNPINGTTRSGT